MRKILALLALVLVAGPCAALSLSDDRIQSETYDKTRVYRIQARVGRTTLIQLEEDEALNISPSSVLGMGDAAAWTLSARGNNIVFKPSTDVPNTNMIIVTNKRTYSFDLKMAAKNELPTYILRFVYPDTEAAKEAKAIKEAQITAAARSARVYVNTKYSWRGDNAMLKPTAAWDDGRFTRLEYDHAGELPVFYKVLPDGTESQVNTNVDQNDKKIIIVQEVIRTVRARLGKEVIEIINSDYKLPKFNKDASGIHGAVRTEIGNPNDE